MEIKTFKIRLKIHIDINKFFYIDETNDFSKLIKPHFQWNWLDVASDYSGIAKEHRENYHKLEYGYDDNDVMMEAKYEGGYCCVSILFNTDPNKPLTVLRYDKQLVTRTLFDWVKISINGSLSDGIGENPVAYYDNMDNEVWLSEIISDEKLKDDNNYFYIPEPISVIDDPTIISSIKMPDFLEKLKELKTGNPRDWDMDKIQDLQNESIKYSLNKIEELYETKR